MKKIVPEHLEKMKKDIEPNRTGPVVLVVDDEMTTRMFVTQVLSDSGWKVIQAIDWEETIAFATVSCPDLIIANIALLDGNGTQATRRIRTQPAPLATVPILAFTALSIDTAGIFAIGMDGLIPKPCTPEVLTAIVAGWRPNGEMDGAHRLAETFGVADLSPLLRNFRAQLMEAVIDLDADNIAAAHRIAGIAGTLGFAAVSASWVVVSQGGVDARDRARRDARMAIAQIDRDSLGSDMLHDSV